MNSIDLLFIIYPKSLYSGGVSGLGRVIELAAGDTMTVDAALVTLDFALRRCPLVGCEHARLAALLPHA